MAYLGLFALKVASQVFGCFDLFDAGPYRLEGGGVSGRFILPPEVDQRRREEGVGDAAPDERSESMKGVEESGWSERRTRALFKHIFRIVWAPKVPFWFVADHQKTGGKGDGEAPI